MDQLLRASIKDRSIIIWGARIVGIGLSRKCEKENVDVIGFVDSDKALQGRKINDKPIISPNKIKELLEQYQGRNIALVIAVSIKEDEIKEFLRKNGLENDGLKILNYKDFNNVFYTVDVVSSCNLKCLSCAHSAEGPKPGGIMKIKDVKQLSKKLSESHRTISFSLYSWGEPSHTDDEVIRCSMQLVLR